MKDFENYECEGQMDLREIYPDTCCGLVPWLHQTRCWMDGAYKEQQYLMYYICPKCKKTAVDSTGWTIRSHGTYLEAKQKALNAWNDPNGIFDSHMFEHHEKLRIPWDRQEEFDAMYGEKALQYRENL